MADQHQDQQDHPPEKKDTTRRATMKSHQTGNSAWSRLRRRHTQAEPQSKDSPVQDHVPCYDNLHWEQIRGYLEPKVPPGWNFHESKVNINSACQRLPRCVR